MTTRKSTIKVTRNIWGNRACFIGATRVQTFATDYDATDWLADQLATGKYTLSAKSDFTMADVEAHRARLA